MKKVLLLTCQLFFFAMVAWAQGDRLWSVNNDNRGSIVKDKAVARLSFPKEFQLFELNAPALRQELFSVAGARAGAALTIISLPNVKGKLEEFEVFEASNFEPDLQARFPEIRAYSGKGITDKYATVKLSISPQGMQGMVFRTDTENEFIEPYSKDHRIYAVFTSHREMGKLPWSCTTEDQNLARSIGGQMEGAASAVGGSTGQLKTLRLAQSCNGEYANYFGATSSSQVGLVLAAYNATLTRCNGVYERDLALHLNLIANTTAVIYYNPQSDPYSTLSRWNAELQSALTSVIGESNYDIGHMFGASGGGGNAGCIGCVCVNGSKGSGITSPADGIPQGDNFDIDYVTHEIGHQLGGNHTFSMSLEGTGQNKEVGSGITIMGYAGITSQDVARHSIDIFHQTTIAQIQANMATKSCPVTVNMSANRAPVAAVSANYTIPISTPFALTGSASDPDNDPITFNWEQNNNSTTSGTNSVASPTKTTGPNWLSFPSTTTPTRLFPRLSTILAGLNVTGPLTGGDAGANIEALSSVSRTLNFRLTVRDNHPYVAGSTIGQTAFTDAVVTVTNTSGPFAVTAPNTNVTWNAGSTATVTWSVNGTNAGAVNCASVNILLSTDGGNTFPIVLASASANDGSQVINVPAITGTNNRVKVEAVGNIFFDISNTNFTITGAAGCASPAGLTSSSITQSSATVSWASVSGAVSYDADYKAASSGTWINAATGTSSLSVNIPGLAAGTVYDWRVRTNCSSQSSAYSTAQFTTTTAAGCGTATGLTASAITQTSATVSWNGVSGANSYAVDYKATSSGTWISATPGTTATTVNLSGLNAATQYDWRVQATCATTTGTFAQNQFTTLAASSACPGIYDVSTNGSTSGAATIPLNTDIFGLINVKGSNDYYKFIITTNGTISLSLTTLPADYQLALVAANGSTIQTSTNSGTSNETINATVNAGTYYARVYPRNNGQSNTSNCYTLRIITGTASRDITVAPGAKVLVSPNPASNYANLQFQLKAGGFAVITVINQAGGVLFTKTVAVTQGINNRQLETSGLLPGTYFVKIQNGKEVQMARLVVGK